MGLLDRLESGRYPGIRARPYQTGDPAFEECIPNAVKRALDGPAERRVARLVSGEFFRLHWNSLASEWSAAARYHSVIDCLYNAFDVEGICCSYVDHDPRGESSGINKIYMDLFHRAMENSRENIRLYCSDVREECNWISIAGDEMHVVDWHEPAKGRANDAEERNTVILEGDGVDAFSRDEFSLALERLAGWWPLGGDARKFHQWLLAHNPAWASDGDAPDDEMITAMLEVAMTGDSALSPDMAGKLPSGYRDLLYGNARNRVPYLLPGTTGLFEFKSAEEIRLIACVDAKVRPPPTLLSPVAV